MLDLSFLNRPEFSRRPIVIRDASAIWHRSQNAATLILVALAAAVFTLIMWGAK